MPAASTATPSAAAEEVKYRLKRIDTLVQSAPLRALVAGTAPEPLEASMGQGPPQLVAATGHGHSGALTIMQRSLVPNVILAVPFTGATIVRTEASSSHLRCPADFLQLHKTS